SDHLPSVIVSAAVEPDGEMDALVARVLVGLVDGDAEVRAGAARRLGEQATPKTLPLVLRRISDVDSRTMTAVVLAIKIIARGSPEAVRDALVGLVHAANPSDRRAAASIIARVRDATLAPELVRALGDSDDRVVSAAHQALSELTLQDFGTDALPWLRWWEKNASRHRVEWLIDALTHPVAEMRRAAGEELRAVTREYFGYSSDLPVREREHAQQRYRDWWATDGHLRFPTT
ncbi:MAG: HEAT repeat domain-containing protein, partial [Polyangiaceae bacterium]